MKPASASLGSYGTGTPLCGFWDCRLLTLPRQSSPSFLCSRTRVGRRPGGWIRPMTPSTANSAPPPLYGAPVCSPSWRWGKSIVPSWSRKRNRGSTPFTQSFPVSEALLPFLWTVRDDEFPERLYPGPWRHQDAAENFFADLLRLPDFMDRNGCRKNRQHIRDLRFLSSVLGHDHDIIPDCLSSGIQAKMLCRRFL